LVAWYLSAGFVARPGRGKEGEGVIISLTKMTCTDRAKALAVLRDFAPWVQAEEPGVLTYAIFTRPKAREEVMLFVRYEGTKALKMHSGAAEHVVVVYVFSSVLGGDVEGIDADADADFGCIGRNSRSCRRAARRRCGGRCRIALWRRRRWEMVVRGRVSPSYSWETCLENVVPKIPDRSSHSHPVRSLSRFSSASSPAIYIVPLTIPGINIGCLSEKFGTSSIIFFYKSTVTSISKLLTPHS